MNQHYQHRTKMFTFAGRSFLEKVLLGIAGVAIVILGFFFLTVALAAGAILAAIISLRVWWIMRKLRAAQRDDIIEGEYRIVDAERLRRSNERDR